jgi:hypothetical protein
VDHISTGAAAARHPDISRRSRRHTALTHVEATRGEIRHRSPRDEIPAEVGGYLAVSSHPLGTPGEKPSSPAPPVPGEQRREHR